MSTKVLLPPPTSNRYLFPSKSPKKIKSTPPPSSSPTKRYKFTSTSPDIYTNIYRFPSAHRSQSSHSNRYYFSLESDTSSPSRFTYKSNPFHSDTPYSFSKTITNDSPSRHRNRNIEYHSPTRMDTTTSTNGSLSKIKQRSPTSKSSTVHFAPSPRRRPKRQSLDQSIESLDKSVDRLVSSVNQKYGQQPPATTHSPLNYISQYYGHFDDRVIDTDDEFDRYHSKFPTTNRIHTNIMKTVHRSLLDRSYHRDQTRLKRFEQHVRFYLRFYERQSLQYELNHNLIRCFSSSYLHDLRQDDLRQAYLRSQTPSYTYEDVQDLYNPSIFEAYKSKLTVDREKYQHIQSSLSTGQLSPVSSSDYSPILIGSLHERADTPSAGLDAERRSPTSISTTVDVFYQIMQDHFRNIDASIAGHISSASRELDTDIEIKSNSSFWSDEDLIAPHSSRQAPRPPRNLSRFLSTVNRSLLDHPSDLIADFYLSQLNRNMQASVRCIESIARHRASRRVSTLVRRSLSAEHLYQVRQEHLRYNQAFPRPMSFTAEDVADIYKRFVLENYKRKIAIELERRRRAREEQQGSSKARIVSPSKIVQTREIVMGRARRILASDGTGEIVQHVSALSPPMIYSTPRLSIGGRREGKELIDNSNRSQTKIYTNVPLTNQVAVCRARRVQSETGDLAIAQIEPIPSLNQHEVHSFPELLPREPLPERMTLVVTIDEHIYRTDEDTPVNETIQPTNLSLPSSHRANETSADSGVSLNTSRTIEPPLIYNASDAHRAARLHSFLEDFDPSVEKQHARQVLDEYFYLNTSNTHIPIMVDEPEWSDEQLESLSERAPVNARYQYPEAIDYHRACIQHPDGEQVTDLDDDLFLLHQQQRSNIRMDSLPPLENPPQPATIVTLNYPNSHSSSLHELETPLRHFEQSLAHEHHLPLLEQVSVSCALTLVDRPRPAHRSLPDEQLVEQWVVEQNIDTIPSDGRQVEELVCLNATNDLISQCSPTSDYESDSVEKDNDTVTSTVIIPLPVWPSSSSFSDTRTRVLSQTPTRLTSASPPIVPIVSFLHALAAEENERLSSTKELLLTLGFGRSSMNEITNCVQTAEQLYRPTWISRAGDRSQPSPAYLQHEVHSVASPRHEEEEQEQILQFAVENQIDHDDTALLIYSHRLQHGHDLGENIQGPLQTFFEPSHFHLPMTTETHEYQTNLSWIYSLSTLDYQVQENELHPPEQLQCSQPKILAYAHTEYLSDQQDELQPMFTKFDQPIYIEHYYIQPLYPFPEPCYAQVNRLELLHDKNQLIDSSFFSNLILTKPSTREDGDFSTQLDQGNQANSSHSSVGVRPPKPNEPGPTCERVHMQEDYDVDMGEEGQYQKKSNYTYENQQGGSQQTPRANINEGSSTQQKKDERFGSEKTVEHSSEDEKSTSSEEVVFEEWTEEFRCRRTDEYDRRTNQLLRTTIDETSGRVKGDVIKEQYKEKAKRIKGRKSYEVTKAKYPTSSHHYEEISPPTSIPNRQWTSEDSYTTEILPDSKREAPRIIPAKPSLEQVITEEYEVEVETPTVHQTTPVRRNSDWRSDLKQKYSPSTDDDQYKPSTAGSYHAQRVPVIPSSTQQRFKEVQIKLPGQERTSDDQRQSSTPPSRHKVKEVLVCLARGSSPEKAAQQKLTVSFDPQTPKKSSSTDEDSPPQPPKRASSLATSYGRVGELKSTFESTTARARDETNKYQSPVTTGLTEQRRRMFEEQEWTPKTATERRLSETHTAPSLVSDRVSHLETLQSDRSNRRDYEITPQTSLATRFQNKQLISSLDSEFSGPTHPIYQSTPKVREDPGHESEDESSDPQRQSNFRRRTSRTRSRDFSQSTAQATVSNMENVLSHVPPSKGKGILIELSPHISQTPTKSNLISDSGVFDASTTTSDPVRTNSRQNVSTSIIDDLTSSRNHSTYVDQYHPQPRTVRRQLINSPPKEYENLTNYSSPIPITTQSRTTKPYPLDEVETVETETRVECNVHRTNERKETTKTERTTSPLTPSTQTLQTTTSPARGLLLHERAQYFQSPTPHERQFQPIQREHSPPRSMHVTSLSPTHQVTFGKNSPSEILAIVNVPQLSRENQDERARLNYQRVHASSYRPPSASTVYQQRPSRSRTDPHEFTEDHSTPITSPIRSSSYHSNLYQPPQLSRPSTRYHSSSLGNLEFEIEIEKRPPQQPEQPTSVSLDQSSRAIITTSKDGRVSIQNIAAYPGHTVVINSDYHASDRSLNRSSGYYSSDEQSSVNPYSHSTPTRRYQTNEQIHIHSPSDHRFDQVNNIVQSYSRSTGNFHDAIDQIDALYNNLDVQVDHPSSSYNFSRNNRRRQMAQNPSEYSQRYTSTGFQQLPYDPDQHLRTGSLGNLVLATPIRPSQSLSSSGILADYATPGSLSPPSNYSSRQNITVQQNRLNNQSQVVQRNRTALKQMKQRSTGNRRRNGNTDEQYSDDENDSPFSDSRPYHFNNYHQ